MARRDRLGTAVFYLSREGVRFDGSDQSAAVQRVLDRGQNGPIKVILDGPFSGAGLKAYSGTTIEGLEGVVVTQAAATSYQNACVFRNANWVSSYLGSTIVDHDITLRNVYVDGNRRNDGSAYDAVDTAPDGCAIAQFKFHGVNRLGLENVYVYDTTGDAVFASNVFGFAARGISALDLGVMANGVTVGHGSSVIQVDGPASDLSFDSLWGIVGDDLVALNACDGDMAPGHGTTFGGSGGYTVSWYGPISRVTAAKLSSPTCANVVRLLSGTPTVGSIAPISQVVVADVNATSLSGGFIAGKFTSGGANTGLGSYSQVLFDGWNLQSLPNSSNLFVNEIGGGWDCLTLSNWHMGDRGTTIPALVVQSDATIGRLALHNVACREDSSEVTGQPLIGMAAGGSIDELSLSNVNWSRNASTPAAMIDLSNGTVNRIELNAVSANNVSNIIKINGATVGGVSSAGMTHRGAGGGASVNVASGTLPRLRAAASDTALLSSGTVSSKKTDGTEDA